MEIFVLLCPMAGFAGFFVLFFGLVIGLIVMGQRQQSDRLRRFGESAAAMGLTLAGPREARGVRDGLELRVVLTSESRGSGKSRRSVSVTRYYVVPDPPLRMGLAIQEQAALFGDLMDMAGLSNDIVVGHALLDPAVRIRAYDPEHARAVLAREDVASAILAACAAGRFRITDQHGFLQHDGWAFEVPAIEARLGPLSGAVGALCRARAHVRAGWEQAIATSWGGFVATHAMTFDPARLELRGVRGEVAVSLQVAFGEAPRTLAQVRLAQPLGIALAVKQTGLVQTVSRLLGGQDVQVGHEAFDRRYTVGVQDGAAEIARDLLGARGGGEAIMKLDSMGASIEADDTGLRATLGGIVTDPRQVAAIMRALEEYGAAMTSNRGPIHAGVFR